MEEVHIENRIAIYVPSTSGATPLPPEMHTAWVNRCLVDFANWFGGATAIKADGAWVGEGGELIIEPVTIVYSFGFEKLDIRHTMKVTDLARTMQQALNQESIALEYNDEMVLIYR